MKNKLFLSISVCILTVLVLLASTFPISAANTVNAAQDLIDGILDRNFQRSGVTDMQSWINGSLTQTAGTGSEWYTIALRQYGQYDLSSYANALSDSLAQNEAASASSRQKFALALIASGSKDDYIEKTLNDSIGRQGIMSWVFGLHLLNNGYVSSEYTSAQVKKQLLSLQCDDGGWALAGGYGNVDVTAMTVQALAPHYDSDAAAKEAVDNALELLSKRQLDDGDYASYGVSNPESGAQVIVALSALGIDFATDERFIKNANTLIDGIAKYRLNDGSFCHQEGGTSNENATVQVFCAMIAYLRMTSGKGSLYLFERDSIQGEGIPTLPPSDTESTKPVPDEDTFSAPATDEAPDNRPGSSYKVWACLLIAGMGGVVCLILLLIKKRHVKNFIAVSIVVGIAILLVCVTNFQSADDYYSGEEVTKDNGVGTVTMTIRCDTIVGKTDSEYVPSNGIILDVTEFEIEEGDTVYDILTEAAKRFGIQVENNGNSRMAYIVGINYLYEFDFGDLSGWVYHVNGAASSLGCSEYILSDGDVIEWQYTCELGNDIN